MKKNKLFLSIAICVMMTFLTVNINAQWTYCPGSGTILQHGSYPSVSVVDQNTVIVSGSAPGSPAVYRTTNGGTTFTSLPVTGISLESYCVWATDANTIYVGDGGAISGTGGNAHVYKTTNGGTSWSVILSTGGNAGFINGIVFSRTSPQIGVVESDPPTGAGQAYWWQLTTDGGVTWNQKSGPSLGSGFASAENAVVCLDALFFGVGTSNSSGAGRIVYTSNGGTSFNNSILPITGYFVGAFAMSTDKLHGFAIASGGGLVSLPNIAWTSNGCSSFSTVNIGSGVSGTNFVTAKWVYGTNYIYILGDAGSNSCKRSTDGGTTWTQMTIANGLNGWVHMEYTIVGGVIYAYAVGGDGSVIKLADNIVGINNNHTDIPSEFKLYQNYPNPFNPSTKIDYSLPKSSDVSIKIYDMLGNEVMSVLNEHKEPGNYSVDVDASRLSSGVYFYTLRAGDFRDSKKMMLVK